MNLSIGIMAGSQYGWRCLFFWCQVWQSLEADHLEAKRLRTDDRFSQSEG